MAEEVLSSQVAGLCGGGVIVVVDGKAAVGRGIARGWGFVDRKCECCGVFVKKQAFLGLMLGEVDLWTAILLPDPQRHHQGRARRGDIHWP